MVPLLKQILVENDIEVALEEGGNPYRGGMRKARESQRFKKTFLQIAREGIRSRTITPGFVDITKKQVSELVETGIIHDVTELKNRPQLRDKYIAQNAGERFSKNKGENGLLLVADKHFDGVKDIFEKREIPIQSDTIDRYDWYRPIDDNLMHSNGEHTFAV